MEKQLREKKIHAAILCNPHNPCGRVWERRELEKAMELYRKYDVYVISDEIWSDLILNGHKHIPSQSVSEDARQRTAAFYAPSKTFNLAGLVGSYHIVYNSWWRDRILKESSLSHYNMMNVLSMHALLGAYQPEGYEWTDELCEVLSGNVSFACDYIDRHFKGVNVSRPEGTYMLFADCTDWCTAHGKNNRRCGKSLLGCRRCRPGRQDVFRSLSPENESGLTPFPHRRSLPPNGSVRLQQVKIHSAIHYNLCYNRAHNISVPSCHFPERCKQEEINMDIKEEIHALSEEMLTNLGRLVAIDSQLGTPFRGKTIW